MTYLDVDNGSAPLPLPISTLLAKATEQLANLGPDQDTSRLDAEVLLCHALNVPRVHLYAHSDKAVERADAKRFAALIEARARGVPVAYLIGQREFWSLPLAVNADTLVPRPETELLVELALNTIADLPRPRLADIGTGTGAIAVAIAHERPDAQCLGVDVSSGALSVARENVKRLAPSVQLIQANWTFAVPERALDIVVSNPPYICRDDPHLHEGDVAHEPRIALAAGVDGLNAIRAIVSDAKRCLVSNGWLMLEHGWNQAAAVRRLLREAGYRDIASEADLAGHERVTRGRH